jgi:hypothetical protein
MVTAVFCIWLSLTMSPTLTPPLIVTSTPNIVQRVLFFVLPRDVIPNDLSYTGRKIFGVKPNRRYGASVND